MPNLDKQYRIFLGRKIHAERKKAGLSQEQLGKRATVHRTYVGMVERGEKNITLSNLAKFAHALGVQVRHLIDF